MSDGEPLDVGRVKAPRLNAPNGLTKLVPSVIAPHVTLTDRAPPSWMSRRLAPARTPTVTSVSRMAVRMS